MWRWSLRIALATKLRLGKALPQKDSIPRSSSPAVMNSKRSWQNLVSFLSIWPYFPPSDFSVFSSLLKKTWNGIAKVLNIILGGFTFCHRITGIEIQPNVIIKLMTKISEYCAFMASDYDPLLMNYDSVYIMVFIL